MAEESRYSYERQNIMDTKVAVWSVLLNGMEILEVPYKDKQYAEQYCKDYNDGVEEFCPEQSRCYLNLVKKPIWKWPDTIIKVDTYTRRVGGTRKDTGEGWSKLFYHVDVHSLVMDKYPLVTNFVGHYHRGEYRITGVCGSLNLEAFSKWVKLRWPKDDILKEFLR